MHQLIRQKASDIADLCRRYRVRQLEVFGSAARGEDFDPSRSDADFLVDFEPGVHSGLTDFLELKGVLPAEQSRNYIRRRNILGNAETIYVA